MNKIEIKSLPEIKLVCVKGLIRSGARINRQIIPDLWGKLATLESEISRFDKNRYALITGDLPGREEEQSYYFAGFRVDSIFSDTLPEGFFLYQIPYGEVATTTHVGSPITLGRTAIQVFRDWLPSTDYVIRQNQELIIYPPHYNRDDPKSEFEYNIFVRRA